VRSVLAEPRAQTHEPRAQTHGRNQLRHERMPPITRCARGKREEGEGGMQEGEGEMQREKPGAKGTYPATYTKET
jgi:hypothetical protein